MASYEERRLLWAVNGGNFEEVRRLLNAGVDVNARDNHGWTALIAAASIDHLGLAEVLVEFGANLNAKDDRGETALFTAAGLYCDAAFVKLLVENGANVHAKKRNGRTALHMAAIMGEPAIAKLLLENGAAVNAKNSHGLTALHEAVRGGELEMVKLLLGEGADVKVKANGGATALHCAVGRHHHLAIMKLLLEKGAIANAKDNDGKTPLHWAVRWSETRMKESAHFLLERGAVAVIADNERLTPLDVALRPWSEKPDVELICRMLLPSGALVQLATDGLEAHEKRLKRLKAGLKRAVESAGFLEDLADTLAGIDASGCARGIDEMLSLLLGQLDAFSKAADDGPDPQAAVRVPKREGLGESYVERRDRHRRAVAAAVRCATFLSDLAEGLAGVNTYESNPRAPKKLAAAALRLDALSEERAEQGGTARAPKRRRPGPA